MKITSDKLKQIRKKVSKILVDVLLISLFVIIGIELGYKFAKKPFYYFNDRFDVVLTDSMSTKNEEHKDFLEGHSQIQAFDFVVSEKITKNTKLDVYDVVIFYNEAIKADDMHRIVDVNRIGDEFVLNNLNKETYKDKDTFTFVDASSRITMSSPISFRYFETVMYSDTHFDADEYYFTINSATFTPTVSEEQIGDYYKITLTYDREVTVQGTFAINKKNYNYNSHFESIRLYGDKDVSITSEVLDGTKEQHYVFNAIEKYLIRGDKASVSDGWFYKNQLKTKVKLVMPKLGYPIRFLSSPYGAILLVGLVIIVNVYRTIKAKQAKKEEKK